MQNKAPHMNNFDFIIFGGTGDLAKRKLFPALYNNYVNQEKDQIFSRIIGVCRIKMSVEKYRSFVDTELKRYLKNGEYNPLKVKNFLSFIFYVNLDVEKNYGWDILKTLLEIDQNKIRVFYLAISSIFFGKISQKIHDNNLVTEDTRVVLEKPIGHDLNSAQTIHAITGKIFKESQIFRIDHYLGKEAVQGLLAFRFANIFYESLWNNKYIDQIQITTAETIGIENRIDYYENTGALRDMIQNHLLQLLCLVSMEMPVSMEEKSIKNEKIKVLQSLKTITPQNVKELTVRGQYQAGIVNGFPVKGYLETIPSGMSDTETFVAIKASIENSRWSGIPFYLRTGKYLAKHVSEIVISFKHAPCTIFDHQMSTIEANKLILRLQNNGGIEQVIITKDHSTSGVKLKKNVLQICCDSQKIHRNPDGYERLLMDIVHADQTLFMGYNEVEESWRWSDSILKSWKTVSQNVDYYAAGTWGPNQSNVLLQKNSHKWHEST
ncbi:glucose-6-phosphate dehydrogenase [Candidatus Liberibacter africanus]|uniref:Glucose-6-phosphate 1-dehydrogenase n=1 Tax=Candidatus Liberibacter africanus PTSAPSY TaxID=1277257 RepID=A0A0G3I3G3_LIBAF|nr:glucose-6-phosphate dehydrogenase [Candidatus Liberibacter africanus]AKK20391.1 glucose-6-phosphate 1-dehydrogenase [Candidatus Liberibacter africanus PTSAPSY]QTP64126.1 glucose-6-phosphate dehydrogenase [Candidatus Liberibacter africanus]